jgi:transcriptional regulator with XRE-family HTH domain
MHAGNVLHVRDQGWAEYLEQAMKSAGLDQASLARAMGVSEPTISRWMNRGTEPQIRQLRKLSHVLHVPLLKLLVAAGHLEPEEAQLRERPKPPAEPEDLLERYLQEFIPAGARDTVRAMVKPLEKDRPSKGDRKIG